MKLKLLCLAIWPVVSVAMLGAVDLPPYEPYAHPARVSKHFQAQTQPRRSMVISSEIGGKISQILVDRGDVIDRPMVFQMDDIRAKLQLAQLEQQKKEAEIQLKRLGVQQQKIENEKNYQGRELKRSEQLQQTGGASAQELQAIQHLSQQAEIQTQEQQEGLEAQKLAIANLEISIQSQSDLIQRHHGFAPHHWVVTERYKEPGEIVSAGEPILKCIEVDSLLLDLALDESEIQAISSAKATWLNSGVACPLKLFYCSPEVLPESRKRKVQWLIAAAKVADCGLEVSLELSWKSPSAGLIIPLNYVEESFSQTWLTNSKGEKIPIKPLQKTSEGWVVPANAFKAGETIFPPPSGHLDRTTP